MDSYSPYTIDQAGPPKWRPGEDLAASAFVGITFYLIVETNIEIFRAFQKRQGLYFWSLECGSLAILTNNVGIVLKYLASSETSRIWPLNAFLLTIGWAIYSTAQSLVLYSRLHLVIRNQRIQRYVFLMILSTIFTFIIPTLVAVWPAFNTSDHKMSSVWSPRLAIMDRYTQIGYTITESTISGLYIWSLLRLLRLKTNVRQRRVMLDLIYVNVVVIAFDILEVVFVYTNQLGISHPIQSFSYILKLRLEFVVLNQLMAVAARGLRRQSFHVKRYHHPSTREGLSSYGPASQQTEIPHLARKGNSSGDSAHIELPSSTYSPNSELDSNVLNHIG
ncbi:hypothetical protein MMC22_007160 [Lobaria immixta]|nr:hypothetical protein [Lobaria immixta]